MPIPPPRPLRARRHPATPPASPPPSPPPLPHPRPPLPNSSAHDTGPCKDGRHPPRPPPSRGLLRSNQTGWPRPWGVVRTRAGVLVREGGRGEGMRGGGGGELRAGTDQSPSPPTRSPPTHPLPTPRWPAHPAATEACALGRSAPLPPLPRSSSPPVRPPAQLPRRGTARSCVYAAPWPSPSATGSATAAETSVTATAAAGTAAVAAACPCRKGPRTFAARSP